MMQGNKTAVPRVMDEYMEEDPVQLGEVAATNMALNDIDSTQAAKNLDMELDNITVMMTHFGMDPTQPTADPADLKNAMTANQAAGLVYRTAAKQSVQLSYEAVKLTREAFRLAEDHFQMLSHLINLALYGFNPSYDFDPSKLDNTSAEDLADTLSIDSCLSATASKPSVNPSVLKNVPLLVKQTAMLSQQAGTEAVRLAQKASLLLEDLIGKSSVDPCQPAKSLEDLADTTSVEMSAQPDMNLPELLKLAVIINQRATELAVNTFDMLFSPDGKISRSIKDIADLHMLL